MEPPDSYQSMADMLRLVQHSCAHQYSAAAVAVLVCLLVLLTLVCVAQTAYMLRLRPLLARHLRESGHCSDAMDSRGRSRRRSDERGPSRRSACSPRWSLGYDIEPCDSPSSRPPSREDSRDSRYSRMCRHRALEHAERCRLRRRRPTSVFRTPTTCYGSINSSMVPPPWLPRDGQSDGAGVGSGAAEARGPARPRARRVVSFPNLHELRAWGAACEAQGYVYDGTARGYVQPVSPEGYRPEDPRFPARTLWAMDLVHLDRRALDDDDYVSRNVQMEHGRRWMDDDTI